MAGLTMIGVRRARLAKTAKAYGAYAACLMRLAQTDGWPDVSRDGAEHEAVVYARMAWRAALKRQELGDVDRFARSQR